MNNQQQIPTQSVIKASWEYESKLISQCIDHPTHTQVVRESINRFLSTLNFYGGVGQMYPLQAPQYYPQPMYQNPWSPNPMSQPVQTTGVIMPVNNVSTIHKEVLIVDTSLEYSGSWMESFDKMGAQHNLISTVKDVSGHNKLIYWIPVSLIDTCEERNPIGLLLVTKSKQLTDWDTDEFRHCLLHYIANRSGVDVNNLNYGVRKNTIERLDGVEAEGKYVYIDLREDANTETWDIFQKWVEVFTSKETAHDELGDKFDM